MVLGKEPPDEYRSDPTAGRKSSRCIFEFAEGGIDNFFEERRI